MVLRELTRYFGHLAAIDRITFGVPPGQCFGLLGANGAGKTTTLRLIAGDLLASQGTVLIDDHDIRLDVHLVGHVRAYQQMESCLEELHSALFVNFWKH